MDSQPSTSDDVVSGGWCFLQANLARSSTATGALRKFNGGGHDIYIVCEPYSRDGKLAGIPTKWRVVHEHGGKCAILIQNAALDVVELAKTTNFVITQVSDRKRSVTVVSVYFPPGSNKDELVAQLSATLEGLNSSCVLIGGDINMRHRLWGQARKDHRSQDEGLAFVDFLTRHNLTIWNDADSPPTFKSDSGHESWIDITAASAVLDNAAHTWRIFTDTESDHSYFEFNLGRMEVDSKPIRFRLNKFRLQRMAHKIRAIEPTLIDQINRSQNPEDLDRFVIALTATFQEVANLYLKTVQSRPRTVPWWDDELTVLRNRTLALKRRFHRTQEPVAKTEWKLKYKLSRGKFRYSVSTKRDNSWAEFSKEVSSINTFALPYRIAANKVSRPVMIGGIQRDGKPCTSLRESVEVIIKTLFPEDNEALAESGEQKIRREYVENYFNDSNDLEFSVTEVWAALKIAKRRRAPGLDGLPYEIIKEVNNKCRNLFPLLFNKCLALGHFPRPWKKAKLVLLNKPGKGTRDPRAYRPICLLSTMSKVLDRLVAQRILHHYHSRGLLNPLQHGFRAQKSCETAGFELSSLVVEKAKTQGVVMISLDVAGAFDNVSWVSILYLLGIAACPMNIFRLVKSYLRDRKVLYNTRAIRVEHETTRGCPQGSCSGPLFWNIVADSLLNSTFPRGTYVQAYADDLVLVAWGKDNASIETRCSEAIKIIESWGSLNKLTFSSQKSAMMPISYMRKLDVTNPPVVYLNGQPIQVVPQMTYLGVLWDRALTFHPHFVERKAVIDTLTYRLTNTMCKWYSKQPSLLKKIYTGAIEPKALYGHGTWGYRLKGKSFSNYLNVVQRRPLLAVTRAYRTAPTLALQVLAGLPPLDLRAIETYAKFLVLRANQPVSVHGSESFRPRDYSRLINPYETHPAAKGGVSFDWKLPRGDGVEIFTDGSEMNERTGAAMVVLYFGCRIDSVRSRLCDGSTVFQAELVGLKLATEFCLKLQQTQVVNIYSDSRSALQSLADPLNLHPLVNEVKTLIQRARSKRRVYLHWVKAHVGLRGNEMADFEAKAATEDDDPILQGNLSSSRLKTRLRALTLQAWQDRWDLAGDKGRHTYDLMPEVSLRCHYWGDVTELLTGHGRFPTFLRRFGFAEDDNCSCGELGDAFHYLESCPNTRDLRSKLRFDSRTDILRVKTNLPILREIAKRVRGMLPNLQRI